MELRVFQVDSFTNRPFAGNPAGVCVLDNERESEWMQSIAAEMNVSETAFLVRRGDAFDLRWFTPTVEVDLCGHATLASAHVLWQEGFLGAGAPALFDTRSGRLIGTRSGEWIELDFPATPPRPCTPPAGLIEALGVEALYVGETTFDYLIEVASEKEVRAARPDTRRLGEIEARGVMLTSRSDRREFDFVSRFFAPAFGIDEDPVTGSAHCSLAPYWARKLGKDSLVGFQASARSGIVRAVHRGDRVILGGQAVTVLRCELAV